MVSLKTIKWEHKLSIIFSVISFALSFITGIFFDNSILNVISKAVVLSIIFAVLGYIVIYVLRNYVPEVFAVPKTANTVTDETVEVDEQFADGAPELENENNIAASESSLSGGEDFISTDKNLPKYDSAELDSDLSSKKSTSLGKHVFEDEGVKYEPKLMAEAIRTMMGKDSE
jgi:hypothetical protein